MRIFEKRDLSKLAFVAPGNLKVTFNCKKDNDVLNVLEYYIKLYKIIGII